MHALRLARALRPARALAPARALSASAAPRAARPPPLADDPYPLPFTSSHVAPAGQSDAPGAAPHEPELDLADPALPFPTPLSRAGESVETLRARLVYQTRKRGTLESDLLMSTFASEEMRKMDEGELREFDRLLDENDWDVYYWVTGKKTPPARWAGAPLLARLAQHARNEGKVARRMPAL